MSAPLKLTPRHLADLSEALAKLTETTRQNHVLFTPFHPIQVQIGDSTVAVNFDEESRTYIVDDYVGC